MARSWVLLLCVYLVVPGVVSAEDAASSAPTVRQVLFVGNQALAQEQLQALLGITPGQPYDETRLEQQLDVLLKAYRDAGYAFATMTPQIMRLSTEQVQIILVIAENARIRLGNFQIVGARLLDETQLRRELRWHPGETLDADQLQQGIDRVLAWYSEIGHPKAALEIREVQYDADSGAIRFRLVVDEGPEVRIAEVGIEGLNKTKWETVEREIDLEEGEVYRQARVDAAVRRLERLGYFYRIEPNVLVEGDTPEEVIFRPQVTEARTGRINGILGYAPAEQGGGTRLTGMLEAGEINLFGTGRRLKLMWKSGIMSAYEIGYEEPWVLGHPIRLIFGAYGSTQEDRWSEQTSRERGGNLGAWVRPTHSLQTGLTLGYERIELPGELGTGAKVSVGVNLEIDTRDSLINPTEGTRAGLALEQASGDFEVRKAQFDAERYLATWPRQVVMFRLSGARAWGREIPPTELFYLGGANTLRGYSEDWFRGPARLFTNLEYRFLVGRRSQFFLFMDTGTVSDPESPSKLGRIQIGYGFGMRLKSKAGAISLHYGIPAEARALDGKIHVSIAPLF